MTARVKNVLEVAGEMAPWELAESYDNVGLLAGSKETEVTRILVALDLTPGVIKEAEAIGAQLVVTHHPILFHARKNLCEDDPEGKLLCQMVRANLAMIAMHTNFDSAPVGVNDALAEALGLINVVPCAGMLRVGEYMGNDLLETTEKALRARARVYGNIKNAKRVAVCGGAGSDFWKEAQGAGADVLITGEVRHNYALDAVSAGMAIIEAGHYETERVSVKALRNGLQNRLNALQYKVEFFESAVEPFV